MPYYGRIDRVLGALAQLVECLHGMQDVSGSNPLCSIDKLDSFSVIIVRRSRKFLQRKSRISIFET